jgi:hypothetical protein
VGSRTAFKDTNLITEKITWVDSGHNFAHTWLDADTVIDRVKDWNGHSVTIGINVYESEDRVALAQTLDAENPNYANVWIIYKTCIIERQEL